MLMIMMEKNLTVLSNKTPSLILVDDMTDAVDDDDGVAGVVVFFSCLLSSKKISDEVGLCVCVVATSKIHR